MVKQGYVFGHLVLYYIQVVELREHPPPLQIDQHEGSLCALHRCGQASPNNVPEEENKKMCVLGMGCGRRASAS